MLQGTHHHPHKKPLSGFDHLMYVVAFVAPLFTVPQFFDLWTTKDASGLSLPTWGAYAISSLLWLFYWREHKEKWIVMSQLIIVVLNAGIVAGIWLFR